MNIALRVLCLIIGYMCGLIETGVIYGKMKGVDIRKHGSGNLGMTNALRVLGPKAGLVVFIGDLLKAFIPCLIANIVFRNIYPDTYMVYVLYTGLGAVLGHNFPFYMKFKGGKGIATGFGVMLVLNWKVGLLLFLIIFIFLQIHPVNSFQKATPFQKTNPYFFHEAFYSNIQYPDFFQNREKALLSCDSFINIPPYIPIVKHIFGRYFVYIIGVSYIVYVYVSYN